ncbi:MAG: hypothetical protein ACE5ID_06995 [Acidobacteriota bacterium]
MKFQMTTRWFSFSGLAGAAMVLALVAAGGAAPSTAMAGQSVHLEVGLHTHAGHRHSGIRIGYGLSGHFGHSGRRHSSGIGIHAYAAPDVSHHHHPVYAAPYHHGGFHHHEHRHHHRHHAAAYGAYPVVTSYRYTTGYPGHCREPYAARSFTYHGPRVSFRYHR